MQKTSRQALIWLGLVVLTTVPFWLTPLDVIVTGWFYQPACGGTWLLDCYPLFRTLFYDSVPWLTGLLLFGSVLLMVGTLFYQRQRWAGLRRQALYVLLVLVLGSGLVVNAVFKEHWGRPRPVQIEAFGGDKPYAPPGYYVAGNRGHSFPSGHVSVGVACLAFWFLWRREHPRRARVALYSALALSIAIGLTRMAAGGHFLSDVIWAGWMVAGVALLLDAVWLSRSRAVP